VVVLQGRQRLPLTLYLFFKSDERAALINTRLTLEGALKCALLDLRLELLTPAKQRGRMNVRECPNSKQNISPAPHHLPPTHRSVDPKQSNKFHAIHSRGLIERKTSKERGSDTELIPLDGLEAKPAKKGLDTELIPADRLKAKTSNDMVALIPS
jgi:hypothetical protein